MDRSGLGKWEDRKGVEGETPWHQNGERRDPMIQ